MKGSRFYFTLTPLTILLLVVSALTVAVNVLIANAIAAHGNDQPLTAVVQPLKIDLSPLTGEQAKAVGNAAKAATDQARKEEAAKLASARQAVSVSPSQPVAAQSQGCAAARPFIYIQSVGLCMHIVAVGLDGEAVGTPTNTYQAGWFNGSAALGSGGASFVDGHSPGSFAAIKRVGYGTIITIGLIGGQDVNYQVTAIQNLPLEQVDMSQVLSSPGLNLMTCNGTPVGNTYSHRFIVYSTSV